MVSTKSKTITKQKMTSSLIELCFPILIEDCDEGIEDDDEESPRKSALQLLDVISISLSSADVLPGIDSFIHKLADRSWTRPVRGPIIIQPACHESLVGPE